MPPPEHGFRELGEREVAANPLFRVVVGDFSGPDGESFERYVVRHPGAVCIVPLEQDATVLMVRQYRAAVGHDILEIPAGKRDVPGEAPEACARRELIEEVGREAVSLTELCSFYNSPGFTDERTICYLAEETTPVPMGPEGAEERSLSVEAVPLAEVWSLVGSGELVDAKTIVACALVERLLARRSEAG